MKTKKYYVNINVKDNWFEGITEESKTKPGPGQIGPFNSFLDAKQDALTFFKIEKNNAEFQIARIEQVEEE